MNAYTIKVRPSKRVIIPFASQLAALDQVTVSGMLRSRQPLRLDPETNQRVRIAEDRNGPYQIDPADGSVIFGIASLIGQAHVTCRLPGAESSVATLDQAIGQRLTVSGFLRCTFRRAGFNLADDAHLFEVHARRAVGPSGPLHTVDAARPRSPVATVSPAEVHAVATQVRVIYDQAADALIFDGVDASMPDYLRLSGHVTDVRTGNGATGVVTFRIANGSGGPPLNAICMAGTPVAAELTERAPAALTIVALPSVDLRSALDGLFDTRLLAVAVEPNGGHAH